MTINLKTICVIFMNHLYSSTLMLACFISKAGCWQQLHIFSLSSQCCCHFFLSLSANACPPVRLWAEASDVFWANKVDFFLCLKWEKLMQSTRSALIIILFQDGMGSLRLKQNGIHLEGVSKFQRPLYVNDIQSRRVSRLFTHRTIAKIILE